MTKLTEQENLRLDYLIDKIVFEQATNEEVIEAGEIAKVYTNKLRGK